MGITRVLDRRSEGRGSVGHGRGDVGLKAAAESFNMPMPACSRRLRSDAMFEYFPGNYVWNLSIAIAMESGAQIGEIDAMCAPLREAASRAVPTSVPASSWPDGRRWLTGEAPRPMTTSSLGRRFSAGTKLHRAASHYQTAERMQPHGSPQRMQVFHKGQEAFRRAVEFGADNLVRMEIPYEGGVIAGWSCRAEWGDGPRPTIIFVNGLDSSKEMLVWTRRPRPRVGPTWRLNTAHRPTGVRRGAARARTCSGVRHRAVGCPCR